MKIVIFFWKYIVYGKIFDMVELCELIYKDVFMFGFGMFFEW